MKRQDPVNSRKKYKQINDQLIDVTRQANEISEAHAKISSTQNAIKLHLVNVPWGIENEETNLRELRA